MLNRRTMLLAPLGMLGGGSAAAKTVEIHVKQGVDADAFVRSPVWPANYFWWTDGETVTINHDAIRRWKTRPDGSVEGTENVRRHYVLRWKMDEGR